jgi:hypothetical protein
MVFWLPSDKGPMKSCNILPQDLGLRYCFLAYYFSFVTAILASGDVIDVV